jgi:hypothetical protein
LPSTTMALGAGAVCACAIAMPLGDKPKTPAPRSKPAKTSPRITRTHLPMRKAPSLPLVAAPEVVS